MKKKLVAFVLAALMVVGLLPTVALADESVLYITLPEELLGDDIVLGEDPTEKNEYGYIISNATLSDYSSNAVSEFGYVYGTDSSGVNLYLWATQMNSTSGGTEYPDEDGNMWTSLDGPYAAGKTYGKEVFIHSCTLAKKPDKFCVNGVTYDTLEWNGWYYCLLNLGTLDSTGKLSGGDFEEVTPAGDSWSYDASTKTFTATCTIPEKATAGGTIPEAVFFSAEQENEDIVFGAGWGKVVDAETPAAFEYDSKYWSDPRNVDETNFVSGGEYGYLIVIAYDPAKLGDLSGAKVLVNGKEYDVGVVFPYDSPIPSSLLKSGANIAGVFLAVDFGELSADGEFSGGDFDAPTPAPTLTHTPTPLGIDQVTITVDSEDAGSNRYLLFQFFSEEQPYISTYDMYYCYDYGADFTRYWDGYKYYSIDNYGWYMYAESETSITMEGVAPHLYYCLYDDNTDTYSEIGHVTLPVTDLPKPSVSDAVISTMEDGSTDITVQITPPAPVENITWSPWLTFEYYVGGKMKYVDIDTAENESLSVNVLEAGEVEYSVVTEASWNGMTCQVRSDSKTCQIESNFNPLYSTDEGTGARRAIDRDGNVYLGGNYIEVGLSKHGSFGTVPYTTNVPGIFHTHWFMDNTQSAKGDHGDSLGLLADGDGWNTENDPIAGDFFVPGGPYECWSLCYQIDLDGDDVCETSRVIYVADLDGEYDSEHWRVEPVTSLVDAGDDNILAARTVGTTVDGVEVTLDYSFGVDDLYYTTEVNVKNNSGKKIENAFYCRDFDPDQDQWFTGDYETYNKTMCNPDPTKYGGVDNNAMVIARGWKTGAGFFFLSMDNRATAIDYIWGLYDCYYDFFEDIIAENKTDYTKYDAERDSTNVNELEALDFIYDDWGIGILCDFGDVESGASDQFVYYSSLDPNVQRTLTAATEAFESDLYTVEFDPNGGDDLAETSAEWKTGMLYDLPVCKKSDKALGGWMLLDAEGKDTDTIFPLDQKVSNLVAAGGTAKLKAVWVEACIVSFESELGTVPDPVVVEYGAKATLPEALSDTGYTFLGWEYNGIIYPAGTKLSFPGRSEVTLTAAWREKTYNVYFDANGGVCVQALKTLGATDVTYGELPTPTHPYAEFVGWYDYYPAYGNLITENSTAPEDETTLYAGWNGNAYDVTINGVTTENAATYGNNYEFNPGEGTYDVTVTIGGETYYPINNEGVYTVAGWAITGDIVITSEKVEDDYVTLIYMFNGDPVYTTVALKTDEYPEVPLPEMEGYTVDGWYADGYYTEKVEGVIGDGPIVKVYAEATRKAIPLTFDGEEAEYSPREYSDCIIFPNNPSDEAHRKFVGWQGDNGVFYAKDADYTYYMPDVESLNFTSVWQDVGDLTITVKDSNGKVSGATVNLIQNGITKKSAVTDANGKASFVNLNYGAYNIVVVSSINETDTVTTTVGQNISAENTNLTVNVPTCKRNTLVDSKELGMNLTAENLSNADKATPNPNEEITITLFAKQAEETNKKAVNDKVAEDYKESGIGVQMVDYIDLTVKKTTKTDDGAGNIDTDEVTLSTTQDYQIIYIELSEEIYAKLADVNGSIENVLAYRLHGEGAETEIVRLKKMPNESAGKKANYECYWMTNVEGKDYVVIKAKNFSTYAIGYQDAEVQAEKVQSSSEVPTYSITGPDTENGKLTISTKYAYAGQTVKITVAPDEGYVLDKLTVLNKSGKELELTKIDETTYSYKMPSGKVTVNASFVKASCPQDETCVYAKFTDADTKAWYHDGVHYCVENGLMIGISDTEFAPNGDITRAQIVTMLWRLDGQKYPDYAMRFSDVPAGEWYTAAVRWAAAEGIVKGYEDDTYKPNKPITREELATILYRYAQYKGEGFTGSWMFLLDFVDRADISEWADEAVHWCSMKGIVNGKDGKVFDPQGNATRAEAAAMMQRFCKVFEK